MKHYRAFLRGYFARRCDAVVVAMCSNVTGFRQQWRPTPPQKKKKVQPLAACEDRLSETSLTASRVKPTRNPHRGARSGIKVVVVTRQVRVSHKTVATKSFRKCLPRNDCRASPHTPKEGPDMKQRHRKAACLYKLPIASFSEESGEQHGVGTRLRARAPP